MSVSRWSKREIQDSVNAHNFRCTVPRSKKLLERCQEERKECRSPGVFHTGRYTQRNHLTRREYRVFSSEKRENHAIYRSETVR